ncbi:MAG: HAD family hydrolase, partial [Candidatus Cryptobacteroides sp.]
MENRALLFDFDGVVADTEGEYSHFWEKMGLQLLGRHNFGEEIKGSTLSNILQTYFPGDERAEREIVAGLADLESQMSYELIPGVLDFVKKARSRGYRTVIVTSSNIPKMEYVYKAHPELRSCFDFILTSEDFSASKPDPDCYLKAMELCGSDPAHSFVFEDSTNGLKSGRSSGARVIGLLTTLPAEVVKTHSELQIRDFRNSEML